MTFFPVHPRLLPAETACHYCCNSVIFLFVSSLPLVFFNNSGRRNRKTASIPAFPPNRRRQSARVPPDPRGTAIRRRSARQAGDCPIYIIIMYINIPYYIDVFPKSVCSAVCAGCIYTSFMHKYSQYICMFA